MRVSEFFHPAAGTPLQQFPDGRIVFGRWAVGDRDGEELIVCRRGRDWVDVHCHGGRTAARRIVDSLVAAGCREIEWQGMAVLCEETPVRTEARHALAAARTERTAAILLAQYHGALDAALTDVTVLLQSDRIGAAADRLRQLDRYSEAGKHLTTPWRVVLAGHANVGKSSLINAILGYERSIVFEQPGTTRDVVTATTAVDGWPVEFADTAGLREGGDAVESTGVALARERLAAADVVVVVFDSTQPWTAESTSLAKAWPDALVVHNKCDLAPMPAGDWPAGMRTSALTGQGIAELVRTLGAKLIPDPPPPGAAVPFSERQVDAIVNAICLLDLGRPEEASTAITRLLEVQHANALPTCNP
jgi:tRNA modification GTPase